MDTRKVKPDKVEPGWFDGELKLTFNGSSRFINESLLDDKGYLEVEVLELLEKRAKVQVPNVDVPEATPYFYVNLTSFVY